MPADVQKCMMLALVVSRSTPPVRYVAISEPILHLDARVLLPSSMIVADISALIPSAI